MVEFTNGQNSRKEKIMLPNGSLIGFYIIGALIFAGVALVYWADAIRERKRKSR